MQIRFHPYFVLSYKSKTSWWSVNEKYFYFLFIVGRALFKSHGNLINLIEEFSVHVIPVRIMVPWYMLTRQLSMCDKSDSI